MCPGDTRPGAGRAAAEHAPSEGLHAAGRFRGPPPCPRRALDVRAGRHKMRATYIKSAANNATYMLKALVIIHANIRMGGCVGAGGAAVWASVFAVNGVWMRSR